MCEDITCEDLHHARVAGMDDIPCDDLTYDDLNPECEIIGRIDDLNPECVRLWDGLTI